MHYWVESIKIAKSEFLKPFSRDSHTTCCLRWLLSTVISYSLAILILEEFMPHKYCWEKHIIQGVITNTAVRRNRHTVDTVSSCMQRAQVTNRSQDMHRTDHSHVWWVEWLLALKRQGLVSFTIRERERESPPCVTDRRRCVYRRDLSLKPWNQMNVIVVLIFTSHPTHRNPPIIIT